MMRTSEAKTLFPRRWMVDHGAVNELVAVEDDTSEFSGAGEECK